VKVAIEAFRLLDLLCNGFAGHIAGLEILPGNQR